jgi:hypothetical protein
MKKKWLVLIILLIGATNVLDAEIINQLEFVQSLETLQEDEDTLRENEIESNEELTSENKNE